jgi:hypothetical protein
VVSRNTRGSSTDRKLLPAGYKPQRCVSQRPAGDELGSEHRMPMAIGSRWETTGLLRISWPMRCRRNQAVDSLLSDEGSPRRTMAPKWWSDTGGTGSACCPGTTETGVLNRPVPLERIHAAARIPEATGGEQCEADLAVLKVPSDYIPVSAWRHNPRPRSGPVRNRCVAADAEGSTPAHWGDARRPHQRWGKT